MNQTLNRGDFEVSFEENRERKYFKNLTRVLFLNEKSIENVSRNGHDAVGEKGKPWFYVKNRLKSINTFKNFRLETNQIVEWNRSRQYAFYNPILFSANIFTPSDRISQNLVYNIINFQHSFKFYKSRKHSTKLSLPLLAYSYLKYDIQSGIEKNGLSLENDSLSNDLRINKQSLVYKQGYRKEWNKSNFTIDWKVLFRLYRIYDKQKKTTIDQIHLLDFSPTLTYRWNFYSIDQSFVFYYKNLVEELPKYLPGYIIKNRNRLEKGPVLFQEKTVWYAGMKMDRLNELKAFDAGLLFYLIWGKEKQIPSYKISAEGLNTITFINANAPYFEKNLKLRLSKFFPSLKMYWSFFYDFNMKENFVIRNEEKLLVKKQNQLISLESDFNLFSFQFKLDQKFGSSTISHRQEKHYYRFYKLRAQVIKRIFKEIALKWTTDYRYTFDKDFSDKILYSDLLISYEPNKSWSLNFSVKNVFNQNKLYDLTQNVNFSMLEYTFVRPREIFLGLSMKF